jgi:glyoxylase-like metal-dependent hydrolase (beta-lactamase superfamily II)
MTTRHRPLLSRRGFCLCCIGATTFAASGRWLTPSEVFAQSRGIVDGMRASAAETPIKVHRLRGGVSALVGSGGNIGVLAGPDGKVLVDAGMTASRGRIKEALGTLGPEPVRHVINTHWHFDHADGNEWLHQEGATDHRPRERPQAPRDRHPGRGLGLRLPRFPGGAVPTEVFATEKTLKANGTTVGLKYYGPSHTDGDVAVTFGEADILHTGDTYWNGLYPFIDYSTGGSLEGTIRATEANLAAATGATIVIPGHGPPASNRAELLAYRDMLLTVRDRVALLKRQGRSLAETVAAGPTADLDGKWGGFLSPAMFTKLVFMGV